MIGSFGCAGRKRRAYQPVVRDIINHEDVVWGLTASNAAPALVDNRAHPGLLDRVEDELREFLRVVDDDTAEADIDRRLSRIEKVGKILRRLKVIGELQKDVTSNIDLWSPVLWLRA